MPLQLPKPLHGWRIFAGEVGVIVLGVLVALSAQQIVETVHLRSDVDQLRSAFRAELSDDRGRWEDMRAGDRCALQRLDAIEHWAVTAPADARLADPFRLMLWNMHSSAWDIAKTSAATASIPLEERLTYADLYAAIDNWRELLGEERRNAVALSALARTADQPESRRQLAFYIAQERVMLRRRSQNYPYFFKRFDALNIRPDFSQLTVEHDNNALCAPPEEAAKAS